jgi:iduronate 2-sulfatase
MRFPRPLLPMLLLLLAPRFAPAQEAPKYNVLFIMSDDMRNEIGSSGGMAKTPNLDKLGAAGVRFDRTFCQYPLCNPSRSSMLTGRDVSTTGVLGNRTYFRDAHPDFVTLPQYFQQHGYITIRHGKIFHGGLDDVPSWNEGGAPRGVDMEEQERPSEAAAAAGAVATRPAGGGPALSRAAHSDRTIVVPDDGKDDNEYHNVELTIAALEKNKDRPFFIACGFSKPHSPPAAPQKFYDLYPIDSIQLPVDFEPRPTVPEGFPPHSIRTRNADLFIGRDASPEEAKKVIQAYLASISWVDDNVGQVLAALDRLGLRDKTIVVFTVDHGYQLGEKGKWSKAGSLFEEGDRIPLIIDVPHNPGNGTPCERIVEGLDIYPTLAELAGLPPPPNLEGRSLVPLLKDPAGEWDHPAFSVWSEDGRTFTGTAVRTARWRYAEYDQGKGGALLFDMQADPHQLKNLANDPKYAEEQAKLSALVKEHNAKWAPNLKAAE